MKSQKTVQQPKIRPIRFGVSALCASAALVAPPTWAQDHEYQTRSYLLSARHNVLDANYGLLCYGGNTVPEYEEYRFECKGANGSTWNAVDTGPIVSEMAVGYAMRLWVLRDDGALFTFHPQGDAIACYNLPPGGDVENMWTVGFPYSIPLFGGGSPTTVYPNHLEVMMTDSSIWRFRPGDFLNHWQSCGWDQVRAPGEVDYVSDHREAPRNERQVGISK